MSNLREKLLKAGYQSVYEFAKQVGESDTNLYRWQRTKPRRLELLIVGALWERSVVQQLQQSQGVAE